MRRVAIDDRPVIRQLMSVSVHAAQALQCHEAGKHVQVEIPLADSLKDAEAVVAMRKRTRLVATLRGQDEATCIGYQ